MALCREEDIRENTAISSANTERAAKIVLSLVSVKTSELDEP